MAERADTERSLESESTENSLEKKNHSEKIGGEKEHSKIRQQQQSAVPSHKPPTGQSFRSRVPTSAGDGLLSPVSFSNTSKQVAKTEIPRSRHIDTSQPPPSIQSFRAESSLNSHDQSAQNEDRSESSLALSDQVRHHSSKLRDAVFAEWLAEKGSHMKKEQEVLQLKKKKQEQAKVEKMVKHKF